jgi:hypothetical protein
MKKNFTKLAIILDRSGSMQTVRASTIDSVNEFINTQKTVPGEASVTFVQFDDVYEHFFTGNLKLLAPLTEETFVPRGWTALYDAIGETINNVGTELSLIPESSRPDKVIVVIVTDGAENMSKRFTQSKIAEMIKRQRDIYSWEFVFVGANQDAVLTAKTINIPMGSAITYTHDAVGTRNVFNATSNALSAYRTGTTATVKYSDEDRTKANVPAISNSSASA